MLELHDEIADLDVMIKAIVDELAPKLVSRTAVGYETAAGDNPDRLGSEASFAALCGVSPIPPRQVRRRHRLNRGGDRAANSALHIIAIGRGYAWMPILRHTLPGGWKRATQSWKPSDA